MRIPIKLLQIHHTAYIALTSVSSTHRIYTSKTYVSSIEYSDNFLIYLSIADYLPVDLMHVSNVVKFFPSNFICIQTAENLISLTSKIPFLTMNLIGEHILFTKKILFEKLC